jgi:hypothetical protein
VPLRRRSVALGAATILVFTGALLLSVEHGPPAELPAIALGWDLLLHLERAILATTLLIALAAIVAQGFAGNLPIEFTGQGFRYRAEGLYISTEQGVKALTEEADRARRERDAIQRRLARLESTHEHESGIG